MTRITITLITAALVAVTTMVSGSVHQNLC